LLPAQLQAFNGKVPLVCLRELAATASMAGQLLKPTSVTDPPEKERKRKEDAGNLTPPR